MSRKFGESILPPRRDLLGERRDELSRKEGKWKGKERRKGDRKTPSHAEMK
jgi:hypothetical protein